MKSHAFMLALHLISKYFYQDSNNYLPELLFKTMMTNLFIFILNSQGTEHISLHFTLPRVPAARLFHYRLHQLFQRPINCVFLHRLQPHGFQMGSDHKKSLPVCRHIFGKYLPVPNKL